MTFYIDTVNTTRISKRNRVKNKMNLNSNEGNVRNISKRVMKQNAD